MLDGNLQENTSPELVERVKTYLRNIGVELLPDMLQPVAILREADGTERAIAAVSRMSDQLSEDVLREFVQTQKYTRAAIYQVTERRFHITHTVDPVTFEATKLDEPQLGVKYIVRGYFE